MSIWLLTLSLTGVGSRAYLGSVYLNAAMIALITVVIHPFTSSWSTSVSVTAFAAASAVAFNSPVTRITSSPALTVVSLVSLKVGLLLVRFDDLRQYHFVRTLELIERHSEMQFRHLQALALRNAFAHF